MNARSIGDEVNAFKGLQKSPLFIGIILFTVLAQYGIVEFGGEFVRTVHLSQEQWIKCILLGALSLPLGGLMRLLPVQDSQHDFASLSDLVTNNRRKLKAAGGSSKSNRGNGDAARDGQCARGEGGGNSSSVFSLSFLLWLVCVTVVPVLVLQRFEQHWFPQGLPVAIEALCFQLHLPQSLLDVLLPLLRK